MGENVLGEGQFATVKLCRKKQRPRSATLSHGELNEYVGDEFAIKIINKDRISSFNSIKRMSNEIDILHKLRSDFVIDLKDTIHTREYLYLITEVGGCDLFDFFDQHPDGVCEDWAKKIVMEILVAIQYCHDRNYCHRDLKPENILMNFDVNKAECLNLKLCDFGLAIEFNRKDKLTEFCGSPGFFAPEMITQSSYYGDQADIWSIGCVILELVLGHEMFCDNWMSAYDYEVLQDKLSFINAIKNSLRTLFPLVVRQRYSFDASSESPSYTPRRTQRVGSAEFFQQTPLDPIGESKNEPIDNLASSTPGLLTKQNSEVSTFSISSNNSGDEENFKGLLRTKGFSDDFIDFVFKAMNIRTNERTSARNLILHPWLANERDNRLDLSELGLNIPSPAFGRSNSMNGSLHQISSSPLNKDIVNSMEVSGRERHLIEEFNTSTGHAHHIHLPPLEPATPSVGKARKMLQIGKDAVSAAVKGDSRDGGKNSPTSGLFSK